jgi:Cu(I)/Ag(I) efflux system membrane fusion protein
MLKSLIAFTFAAALVPFVGLSLVLLAGCTREASQPAPNAKAGPTAPAPAKPEAKTADAAKPGDTHEGHNHAEHAKTEKADPEVAANLAKLSAEDRALAEKQKKCPVTGDLLGSMDVPVKVVVKGKTVFLCCEGCESDIKADPDKFLAKLGK